jgi:DeoR family transcriptional regulator, glycerol-3-phosphate regulon repressor
MTILPTRQADIVAQARSTGRVVVEELARRFDFSPQTIRKDLNELCERHLLTRVHGGAIVASGVENIAYEARRFVAAPEKKAIGAAAAALIPNNCSLFINIGTTTEEVAAALTAHEDLLVITNNLNVAVQLYRAPRIEVIVAGGAVRRADGGIIGSSAVDLINQFKVDYAIIGASAIEADGTLLDFDYREVRVAQAIMQNARHVMLVADSSKLKRNAAVRIANIGQVQTFVTDGLGTSPVRGVCRDHGIRLVEAAPQLAIDSDEFDS